MELFYTDYKSLLVQFNHQEKQLKLKRRWLMGLPMSKNEQRLLEESMLQNDRIIRESLLREDDVYYETIKSFVEKGVGVCNAERVDHVVQDNIQLFLSPNNIENLFSLLDNMTNIGLCHFAAILTGGSIKFEKTRWKTKKIIKEYLPKVLRNQNDNHHRKIYVQLARLLKDSHNFRRNCVTLLSPASQSYHGAAMKILDGLEDLPTQTLRAMHRKLIGVQGYMPQLQPPKRGGLKRDILIDKLRGLCLDMLSELDEGDVLQDPLAEAMTVAGLTLKLILRCHAVTEFKQFSPDIEFLQNEIAKAIWLLNQKGRFPELKDLQFLLDPDAELSNRGLQIAVRNLLTDYLFEFSDMDNIPKSLLETLAIINKSSRSASCRHFSKEEIEGSSSKVDVEEEVECILNVSAQTKQIVWDLLPEHEFDQDFADAYMEDLEESDDDDGYDDVELVHNTRFHSNDSKDQVESIGETNTINPELPASTTKGNGCSPFLTTNRRLNSKLESMHITETESVDPYSSASSSSCLESKILDSPRSMDGNQYQLGSTRNMGSTEFHSHRWTATRRVYSSPGISNGNYTEREQPKFDSAKSPDLVSSNSSYGEVNFMHDKQSMSRNQYLAVQEASDETSVVAYRLIGCMLDNFAHREGLELKRRDVSYLRGSDPILKNCKVVKEEQTCCEEDEFRSVITQAVEEIIPSFPKRGKRRLKKLMGLH